MKTTLQILRALDVESVALAVILLAIVGAALVSLGGAAATALGDGVFIGLDVPQAGTNAWQ